MLYPTFSFILRAFFTFVPFLIFSRFLSVESYASLSFYYSLFVFTSSLSEFGFTFLSFREAAIRFCYATQKNILIIKLVLSIGVSLLVCLYALMTGFMVSDHIYVLVLFVLSGISNSFGLHLSSVFRAIENFKVDFTYNLIKSLFLFSLLVVFFCFYGFSLLNIATSFFLSSVISFFYVYKRLILLRFDDSKENLFATLQDKVGDILLYGIQTILFVGYMQLDSQIVAHYLGTGEMSKYLDLSRIIIGGAMAGEVLVMRITPKKIRDFNENKKVISSNNSYSLLFFLAWFILVVLDLFNINPFVLFYGNKGLRLHNSFAFMVMFIIYLRTVAIIPSTLLSSSNHKIYRIIFLIFTLIISLSLNILLIPLYGINAAFFSMFVANLFICFSYVIFMRYKWQVISVGLLEYITLILFLFSFLYYK